MSDIAVTSTRSCICATWQHSCWRARCADVVRDGQTDDSTYDEMIAVIEGSTDEVA